MKDSGIVGSEHDHHSTGSCFRAEMSSKERTKKYRGRLKENDENYETVKKKN